MQKIVGSGRLDHSGRPCASPVLDSRPSFAHSVTRRPTSGGNLSKSRAPHAPAYDMLSQWPAGTALDFSSFRSYF